MKFLAGGNWRSYKKFLVGKGKIVGVEIVPTQKFEMAEHGSSFQDEAVKNLGKFKMLACLDIILSIDAKTALERLHLIWSIHATLKTFLKETVD